MCVYNMWVNIYVCDRQTQTVLFNNMNVFFFSRLQTVSLVLSSFQQFLYIAKILIHRYYGAHCTCMPESLKMIGKWPNSE